MDGEVMDGEVMGGEVTGGPSSKRAQMTKQGFANITACECLQMAL